MMLARDSADWSQPSGSLSPDQPNSLRIRKIQQSFKLSSAAFGEGTHILLCEILPDNTNTESDCRQKDQKFGKPSNELKQWN